MKEEKKAKRVERLIKRLTDGTWEKAIGKFCRDDTYCILGAISKVYQDETGREIYDDRGHNLGSESELAEEVAGYYGFKEILPKFPVSPEGKNKTLISVNDRTTLSIKDLGKLIKTHAKELFVDPPKPKAHKAKPKAKKRGPTLAEFIGGPLPIETRKPVMAFVDAHLAAEKRREEKELTT